VKSLCLRFGLISVISLSTLSTFAALKVAFIGDSITYGVGSSDRTKKSYPVDTGRLLMSSDYTIQNYGVSSTTMLKKGDHPYWTTSAFTNSLNSSPDIVVIMLGSNDSKPQNWAFKSEFLTNAEEMISRYRNLPSHPTVYINTSPTPQNDGNFGITEAVVGGEVVPLQLQAAEEMGCPVSDVHSATAAMPQNFPDNIHPNDAGALVIADTVYETLRATTHNDNDPQAVYTGSWTVSSGRSFGDYLADVHATKTNGNSVQFSFTGARIDCVTELNSDEGNVDVYLDNALQGTVTCSSPVRHAQATVFSLSDLPSTAHTIKLVKKSGTYAIVDAFRTSYNILDDGDSAITYSGSWATLSGRASDFNQSIHYVSANGSYAQATFSGTQVEYLSEMKSDKGNVDVYVDNVFQQTVNCTSGTNSCSQATLYRKTGLAAGSHTVKLVKTSGTYMALDALRFQ